MGANILHSCPVLFAFVFRHELAQGGKQTRERETDAVSVIDRRPAQCLSTCSVQD